MPGVQVSPGVLSFQRVTGLCLFPLLSVFPFCSHFAPVPTCTRRPPAPKAGRHHRLQPPKTSCTTLRKTSIPKGLYKNRTAPERTAGKAWLVASPLMRMKGSAGSSALQR